MNRRRLATAIMLATATTLATLFAAAQSAEPPSNLTVARVRHIQPAGAAEVDLTWWWFGEQGPDAVGFTIQWVATSSLDACPSFPSLTSANTHYEAGGTKRTATISPLNRQKTYCFRIRTDAADDNADSGWSTDIAGPVNLQEETPSGTLPEPDQPTADLVGDRQVRLRVGGGSCQESNQSTQWQYAWRDIRANWEDYPDHSGILSAVHEDAGYQTLTINMTNGQSYVFRVRYGCGAAPPWSSWSFETDPPLTPESRTNPLGPPVGLRAGVTKNTAVISWQEGTGDPYQYRIQYSERLVHDGGVNLVWSDLGPVPGSTRSHTLPP